jgi:hypothetical protein
MSRTGFLVIIALIFALAAAGVLVWTNVIDFSGDTEKIVEGKPSLSAAEMRAMNSMKQVAVTGGFAATFSGPESRTWDLAAGHRLERFSLNGGGDIMGRLISSVPLDNERVIDGLYVELPAQFAEIANGRRIEVGVLARGGQANPSSVLSVLYATRQAGNSGWKTLNLSPTFELRKFSFDVPKLPGGYQAQPVIALRGDAGGRGLTVELVGVYATVIIPREFKVDFASHHAEWIVPEGHALSVIKGEGDDVPVGRLVSSRPLSAGETDLGAQGASLLVPLERVQYLNGKKIEIVVRAKSSPSKPSDKLSIVFATQQVGNSGWLAVPLSPEMQTHRLKYSVPAVKEGYKHPALIVVQADESGSGASADIESILINPID